MATESNFSIRRGRTGTITVTVTGVSDWNNMIAKLYAYSDQESSSVDMVLTGTCDGPNNKITFNYSHSDTKVLMKSSYYYDITIYKADYSYVKDVNYGLIYIEPVAKRNPS